MTDITFVTGNQHKIREASEILGFHLKIKKIELDEIQELDVEKVTLHKLQQAYKIVKSPVIVEDVGVYFDAWNGFPGAFIKWLIKAGDGSTDILLKMMKGEKNRNVTARLILAFHDGKAIHTFEGVLKGTISQTAKGNNGFDWDKIYIPDGYKKTFAEMSQEEKNKISHRALALKKFKPFSRRTNTLYN